MSLHLLLSVSKRSRNYSKEPVLVAATKNGAEFLRIANTGTIESGKIADLVVLDANRLDDITNTRKINAVYLRGVAVPRN